jgi:hypothetical protein
MPMTTHSRTGLSPLALASNAIVWISAVIVMGILSYLISLNNNQGDHIIYEEVIVCPVHFAPPSLRHDSLTTPLQAVLTVAFFLVAFFLGAYPGYVLLFNLVFSYLWLVAVAFTASDFTYSNSALLHTVEAFSFIALCVNPVLHNLLSLLTSASASSCSSTLFTIGISATEVERRQRRGCDAPVIRVL